MKKDSGFLLLVIIMILSYFIFRGKLFAVGVSPGKKFDACNPCDFKLSVGPHQFQFNNITLKATITESSSLQCTGAALQYLADPSRDTPDKACSACGLGSYQSGCGGCYGGSGVSCCGGVIDYPTQQFCCPCGNYVNVYPNSVTVTLGGSTIYTWNGGDLVGYSINIADLVNSMCIDAATDCTLTIYAQSDVNQGGIQFAVETETYSSIPAVTTTTTPIIITTTIPGGTSGTCI